MVFPELHTERFLLRQVVASDLPHLFKGLGDPVAMPYNGVYYQTLEDTKAQLSWYEKNWQEGTGIPWKITRKTDGAFIGVISVYHYKPEHRKAELGYWILPAFWKQGIASEVVKPVVAYWQEQKGLHRLEAFVEDGNEASIRLLKRAGFTYEGTLRDCEIKFGKFISLHVYSCLAPDDSFANEQDRKASS